MWLYLVDSIEPAWRYTHYCFKNTDAFYLVKMMLYRAKCNDKSNKYGCYAPNLRNLGNFGLRLNIGCYALTFHIFKNLRLFDKKNVAGLKTLAKIIQLFYSYTAAFKASQKLRKSRWYWHLRISCRKASFSAELQKSQL